MSTEGECRDIEAQMRYPNVLVSRFGQTAIPATWMRHACSEGWQRVENAIVSQFTQQPIQLAEPARQQWTASEEESSPMVNDPQFQVAGEHVKLLAEQALDTPEKEAYYIQQKRVEINARRLQEFVERYALAFTLTPTLKLRSTSKTACMDLMPSCCRGQ